MNTSTQLKIDGRMGEGGGQVLRTSLGLSMVTGQSFAIDHIRGNRPKPGLMRQHLTGVNAAARICGGQVEGNFLRSDALVFEPGEVMPGHYDFAVGSAGGTALVLQAILPALLCSGAPMQISIEGGTHNPMAPSFDFLKHSLMPLLAKMGVDLDLQLERFGFVPAGGGRLSISTEGGAELCGLNLMARGTRLAQEAVAYVSNLPVSIAQRELKKVQQKLRWSPADCMPYEVKPAFGPGNVICLRVSHDHVTEVFTENGRINLSAERVAGAACKQVETYLQGSAAAGEYLTDQLLLPMALAAWRGGGKAGAK